MTAAPASRTTTLRTIIKPDSEQYHSNSGIHVTFNTESKDQAGHQFQEHIEESALQPVISDIRNPSVDQPPPPVQFLPAQLQHQHQSQHQHHHHQRQFSDQRARAFEVQYTNHAQNAAGPPQTFPNFAAPLPLPPFTAIRATPDQGLLLSYNQNQANRYFQSQSFDNRNKQRFPDASIFAPSLGSASHKFRTQPKPIPIPLHHGDKSSQKSTQPQQHHQHYTNLGQSNYNKPQQFRTKPQPSGQFQQSFPQPIRNAAPATAPGHNQQQDSNAQRQPTLLQPVPNFSQELPTHNTVLFQQKAPNLATANAGSTQSTTNNFNSQQHSTIFGSTTQDFNRIVSGAELIEALPKYEQHITETVPLSELNKPFSPFRQLATITQQVPGQQQVQEQQLIQQSFEHAKLLQEQQQQQNQQRQQQQQQRQQQQQQRQQPK